MSIAAAIASVIGVPSIPSLVLLADFVAARFHRPLFARNERRTLLWTMAIASVALYPSALGYIDADVYRLGFSTAAPLAIAAAGIALAVRREFRLACVALAVLIAVDVELLPSSNVFDFLVDPAGGLVSVIWLLVRGAKWLSARTLMRVPAGAFHAERQSGAAGGRPAAD